MLEYLDAANFGFALGLTILAGLSTGIGGLFVYLFQRTNAKLLSIALGFSAGVMIYVSFVEIFFESRELLIASMGETSGACANVMGFFGGVMFIAIIDRLVPAYKNPHETHRIEEANDACDFNSSSSLLRTGLLTALVVTIHNLPEGMATFISAVQEPYLGIAIAIAVAIHNVPEGISVAIPIYCATGNRKKAFLWSFLSGLAEPVGAIIAYLILMPFLNDIVFGVLFASIAGIMVFISLDELLPTAREYGEHHLAIYGLITGMMVMALSLLIIMP